MGETLTKISIKSLKIDDHCVDIPIGLSELLECTWVAEKKEGVMLKKYHRKVINVDDHFITVLTKKGR